MTKKRERERERESGLERGDVKGNRAVLRQGIISNLAMKGSLFISLAPEWRAGRVRTGSRVVTSLRILGAVDARLDC